MKTKRQQIKQQIKSLRAEIDQSYMFGEGDCIDQQRRRALNDAIERLYAELNLLPKGR